MDGLYELANRAQDLWTTLKSDPKQLNISPFDYKSALFVLGATLAVGCAFSRWRRNEKTHNKRHSYTPGSKRAFGDWAPQSFSYPKFDASSYPLNEIKPPMYRPFRWGEYHVTMGIRSMHWGEWIELDDQFESYYRIRKHRLESKPRELLTVLPASVRSHDGEGEQVHIAGGSAGAIELVHELAEYLSRRYPTTFQVERHDKSFHNYPCGWDGLPPIKAVKVSAVDEKFELPMPLPLAYIGQETPDIIRQGEEAMRIASLLVQDDLALMVEGTNGGYYFQAGAILVGGFWRMVDKIGKRLDEIHISGHVPQYAEKLQVSLERFFRRLSVDKPVVRNNYFVQISPPSPANSTVDPDQLAWGEYVLGPEETYGGIKGTSAPIPPPPVVTPQNLRMRTERQTLRRLPRSGAIVFTIRTYLVPVEELTREPGVAARFASAVRSWTEDVVEYKGQRRYSDVLLKYLDEMAAKDESGEIETRPYPF
ncbi:hypothetical protein MIND_00318100 [Mycena indigotica]|uniref:Uncharacterized protein n=1 Tax=Mycena indigotica TaxID=2126181 RepID=A0A8H6T1V4_9AGAR|nr:uncharacterized protein MIND_00318100 [Mycena indigotica]KAF7309473.1 hypothetical protein MIND_00318100 [Mycena indigotica]